MRSLILMVLLVASATAWADPGATDQAQAREVAAERKATQLADQQKALSQRYESQLQAIDKLKQQRASWRRDREVGDSMATAQDTANQLAASTRELTAAQSAVTTTRRALVEAIDAELPGATGARAERLAQLRGQIAPQTGRARKIILPDDRIDLKADPEELDDQAAALRDSEGKLAVQVAGLDAQGKELDHVALLRKQHERAGELGTRDDDQSHRTGAHSDRTTSQGDGALVPSAGGGATSNGASDHSPAPTSAGFESEASIVLADVVDAPTIDSLARAQRSGVPGARAAAVKRTRDAVAARLEHLRQQRAQIEARAKTLRQKR